RGCRGARDGRWNRGDCGSDVAWVLTARALLSRMAAPSCARRLTRVSFRYVVAVGISAAIAAAAAATGRADGGGRQESAGILRLDDTTRLLVVAPHPDDEVLAAG